MKELFRDPLLMINTGVLTLSMTNVELGLKIILLVLTIILTTQKIIKYFNDKNANT